MINTWKINYYMRWPEQQTWEHWWFLWGSIFNNIRLISAYFFNEISWHIWIKFKQKFSGALCPRLIKEKHEKHDQLIKLISLLPFNKWRFNFKSVRVHAKCSTSLKKHWPFNSQIKFVILLTVNHTILIMLVQRI